MKSTEFSPDSCVPHALVKAYSGIPIGQWDQLLMRANSNRVGRFPRTSFQSPSNPHAVYSSKPVGSWEPGEGQERFLD